MSQESIENIYTIPFYPQLNKTAPYKRTPRAIRLLKEYIYKHTKADDVIIEVEEPLSFESFDKIIVSIIAKKVAVSTNHLVLDIPIGKTMKIKRLSDGERVAQKFRKLAERFDIKLSIDINPTLEPAGRGVGPSLEVRDALYVLEQNKKRPLKLEAKALRLASKLLDLCYKSAKINKNGEEEAKDMLTSGKALKKLREIRS